MSKVGQIYVGTAGWAISACKDAFQAEGSTLQRYATRLRAVEINSSFHRRHQAKTWERWAAETPDEFRFSVKLPKAITHQARLIDCTPLITEFIHDVSGLGDKLAVLLVQLPPSLALDAIVARRFFTTLAQKTTATLACEPRHLSWFDREADDLLVAAGVARVAADPSINAAAAVPGGSTDLAYWRLHGSPRMYRSDYADTRLRHYAAEIGAAAATTACWCMFDNTASSAAIGNALSLSDMLI